MIKRCPPSVETKSNGDPDTHIWKMIEADQVLLWIKVHVVMQNSKEVFSQEEEVKSMSGCTTGNVLADERNFVNIERNPEKNRWRYYVD